MRIAMVGSSVGQGLLYYPVQLACVFKNLGHDVTIYTYTDKGQTLDLAHTLRNSEISVTYRTALSSTGMAGLWKSLASHRNVRDENQYDVLFTFGPMATWQLKDVVKPTGLKISMISSMGHDRKTLLKTKMGAFLLNVLCDRVLALCHLEQDRLLKAGVQINKLRVVHNFLDCKHLQKCSDIYEGRRDMYLSLFNLNPSQNYIGCLANFEYRKRQDILIRAYSFIASDFPNFDLVLAGEGQELERCRRLAVELGLQDRVHFLGRIPNDRAEKLLACLDCFALVSNAETFCYSFVEPLFFGKPTLVSRVGIGWELEKANLAVVVPPNDVDSTIFGLKRILRPDSKLIGACEDGKEFVTKNFNVNKIANQILSILEEEKWSRKTGQ